VIYELSVIALTL